MIIAPLSRRHLATGLLALSATASPLTRAIAQASAQTAPPEEDPAPIDTNRDPFEHMLAPVSINDRGPFRFMIDTGANTSCISNSLAQQLMLAKAAPAVVHTVVGARERPGVLIDRLKVGERDRKEVRVAALPLAGDLDGVLGVDWLKGQRLELGFKSKTIAITRSKYEVSKEGIAVVPARRSQGQLTIVDADLGGRRISAMIDSGAQMSLCNAPLRALIGETSRRELSDHTSSRVELESLIGEQFVGELIYLPFLRLGGLRLGLVPVVFADVPVFELWGLKDKPAIVLGMDLLTQFDAVALDFGQGQVRFDLGEALRAPPTNQQPRSA